MNAPEQLDKPYLVLISIVTGLYPAHHGIVANEFRDAVTGNWYVSKQKTSSEDVDDNAHRHGPASAENTAAIARVDSHIQRLVDGLVRLPYGGQVNIVLVSDHGQSAFDHDKSPFIVSDHFDLSGTNPVDGGTFTFLYFDQPEHDRAIALRDGINPIWDCGQAYLPEDSPSAWQVDNNPRFADVFLLAHPGCAVLSSSARSAKITSGDHGWPPEIPEMRGIFIAAGPALPVGLEIGPVRIIDIYPLLMGLLGLEPRQDVDSDPFLLVKLLH